MIKRPLGKTGIEVSEIAFGGVEIGVPYGIGIKSAADMLPEAEAIKLLHRAIDSGINFFDTARMYGNSETIMGKAFKNRRDDVVIGTKCRHLRDENGNIPKDLKLKEIIETSLNESLEALQTDHVDIFMLHQADISILENEEILTIFSDLKKKGKCSTIGVSTYSPEETKKAIEVGMWNIIQVPFNLMDQRQGEFFSLASNKGIGIIIRSVLLKGLLSDRGKGLHPALAEVEKHIKCYDELLEESAYNLSTLATKFALSFPEVSAILVGIDRPEYLYKSLEAANGIYLNNNKLARAKELSYPDPGFLNLPYWDKMNWLR
jgi:aryl-alcohol dehydrogenase-like predicted oxidoreductase